MLASPAVWRFLLVRYLPLFGAANLAWEVLHLPLYTIWYEEDFGGLAYAILHCTAGDLLIGTLTLLVAAMLFGGGAWPHARHGPVLAAAMALGIAFTVASEWISTRITLGWQYAEAMPVVPPFGTGLTALLQWVLIPPAAYAFAVATTRRARAAQV
jgi:hypothetical protein